MTLKSVEIVKVVIVETKIFHGVRLVNDESQYPNHISLENAYPYPKAITLSQEKMTLLCILIKAV